MQKHFPRWCPATHAFFRRQQLKTRKMNLQHALNDTEDFQPAANFYRDRVTQAQMQEPTTFSPILAGQYLPNLLLVSEPGQIPQATTANPDLPPIISHSEMYPMALSSDVTLHEQPALDQCAAADKELVAKLQMHAMFRERTTDLLLSLKSKALQELKPYSNSSEWKAHQLAMSVALAFVPSEQEKLAFQHLRSPISSTNWLWVNDVLKGNNSELMDHKAKTPALATRLINWLSTPAEPLRSVPVKK